MTQVNSDPITQICYCSGLTSGEWFRNILIHIIAIPFAQTWKSSWTKNEISRRLNDSRESRFFISALLLPVHRYDTNWSGSKLKLLQINFYLLLKTEIWRRVLKKLLHTNWSGSKLKLLQINFYLLLKTEIWRRVLKKLLLRVA